jgi:ubiquitin C-terminal hydrolase
MGGHYALLVRRFDKWYLKDDETVKEVEPIHFKSEFYQAWYRP